MTPGGSNRRVSLDGNHPSRCKNGCIDGVAAVLATSILPEKNSTLHP